MPRRWLAPDFFTDEKMKKATVAERLLAAAFIANQDDDGRLRGDPAYLRSIAFLYDDYSLDEVRKMRDHLLQVNPNILLYENAGEEYIQLKRYKRYQKPRYYHPSKLPAPPGWPFEESNQVVTTHQPISAEVDTKKQPTQSQKVTAGMGKDLNLNLNKDLGKGQGKGAQAPPTPSPPDSPTEKSKILETLTECFRTEFGRVPADAPDTVLPREPTAREKAQMRELAQELVPLGGYALSYIRDAFKEAAAQPEKSKKSVSYVRAILLDWLGLARPRRTKADNIGGKS